MLRCKDAKVQRHKGTKVQRCNTALYNGFVPHNSTAFLNGMVQFSGAVLFLWCGMALNNDLVLLYGMAWCLKMAQCQTMVWHFAMA